MLRVRHDNIRLSLLSNGSKVQMQGLLVGSTVLTGYDMVNYANTYFVNVTNSLTSGFQSNGLSVHLTRPNPNSCIFLPTDIHEVILIIKSLKNNNSGFHDISIKSLKNNDHEFSVHIACMYKIMLEKMTNPNILKVAQVVPGHKSGQKGIIDNCFFFYEWEHRTDTM